ncbi:MAG: pentapeptide repeat-containing protein [Desulfarculales bacterium]|jgi:uncharacterized protein YjbI with pentapeptide repeats|nr:pentapeptide repeat-containing protein [Desulfarculales bacterium]
MANQSQDQAQEIRNIPKVELLFEENIEKFNQMAAGGKAPDLRNTNLSNMDLRHARLKGLDLSGCYLKGADMRGVDLSGCNLQGVSMEKAKISGCLFPDNVSLEEVKFSVEYGTRIRTSPIIKELHIIMALTQGIYKLVQEASARIK